MIFIKNYMNEKENDVELLSYANDNYFFSPEKVAGMYPC